MSEDATAISEAFATLGDETRVAILEALVDARREDPTNAALSFSDLRERVGVADSGRFNYHLGKLRDRFVEETDDGYELTYAGREVVGAILSGSHDPDLVRGPTALDDDCPVCAAGLAARYEYGDLTVECENGHTPMQTSVPPAAASERSTRELLAVAARSTYAKFELVAGGVCFECHGSLDRRIEESAAFEYADYTYVTRCERCGVTTNSVPPAALLREPAFIAFCHDRGYDLGDRLPWSLPMLADGETSKASDDPPRYEVELPAGDEVLVATLDEHGEVVATERV